MSRSSTPIRWKRAAPCATTRWWVRARRSCSSPRARPSPSSTSARSGPACGSSSPTPSTPEGGRARLKSSVRHKRAVGRPRREQAVQDEAGLYTTRGLALRAQELTLQAFHHGAALACVALAPVPDGTTDGAEAVQLVGRVLRTTGRRSDAIGRIGPSEFAVVAPGTDGAGAVMLAQRVARAVRAASGAEPPALRAGYDAVGNTRYTPVEPKNLLARATSPLRIAKGEAGGDWNRAFAAAQRA